MVNNFLMGGKLGDFLHAMFAVKHLSSKANVYMYNIGWEFGIENTYAELAPILLQQEYIQSVSLLTEYTLDPIQTPTVNSPIQVYNKTLTTEGYVDLGRYIQSPWLYKICWSELYSNTFNFPLTHDAKWLTYNRIDERFIGKVLIHRRNNPIRLNPTFPFDEIIEQHKDNVVFVSSNETDYIAFPHHRLVPFERLSTLDEWFTAINSCGMLISNLTAPAVIGHALDVPRIIELPNTADAIHCIGEEKHSSNVHWYMSSELHNLKSA